MSVPSEASDSQREAASKTPQRLRASHRGGGIDPESLGFGLDHDPRSDDSEVLDVCSRLAPEADAELAVLALGRVLDMPRERVTAALYRIWQVGFDVPLPPLTPDTLRATAAAAAAALEPLASVTISPIAHDRQMTLFGVRVRCADIWTARDVGARVASVIDQLRAVEHADRIRPAELAETLALAATALAQMACIDAVNNDDPTFGRERFVTDQVTAAAVRQARDACEQLGAVARTLS